MKWEAAVLELEEIYGEEESKINNKKKEKSLVAVHERLLPTVTFALKLRR